MRMGNMQQVFGVPSYPKPRQLRQTWLKDVGYDEAPKYHRAHGIGGIGRLPGGGG